MSKPPTPTAERLRKKTKTLDNGCIVFTGYVMKNGYATILHRGEKRLVHRVAYELANGPVPEDLHIHHRCETKLCVNPAHLAAVDAKQHKAEHAVTHCVHGHEFTLANTRVIKGARHCRKCDAQRQRDYRARAAA